MSGRSKGALALLRLGKTQPQLASALSVSNGIVAMWQSGDRTPSMPNRKSMREKFGIPLEAWDESPETPLSSIPPERSPEWRDSAATSRIEHLQALVDQLLQDVKLDADMTPLERSKVMAEIARTQNSIRRQKGEDIADAKLMKLPKWHAIWTVILDVLKDEPEYLRTIRDRLDDDERRSA